MSYDGGLLLKDALRVYGDPQLRRAYEEALARRERIPRRPNWVTSRGGVYDEWCYRYEGASKQASDAVLSTQRAMLDALKARLIAGELVATGLRLPPREPPQAEPIPPEIWPALSLDPDANRAWTKGLDYRGVRVWPAIPGSDPQQPPSRQRGPKPATHSSSEGPPKRNAADMLRAEMKRRKRAGLLTGNWSQDSKSLSEWMQAHVPGRKPRDAGSIERRYREEYRKLMADKKGGH